VIAFIGSVFSPYYARALRKGSANPEDHCAINVALYGKGGHHWAMTERGVTALKRDHSNFVIGPSSMCWDAGKLVIDLSERTTPFMTRIAGRITVTTGPLLDRSYPLDAEGRHIWQPLAPSARVELEMTAPKQSWRGHGYFDTNAGTRPIAQDFKRWDWARASTISGALIHYDVTRRDGSSLSLGLVEDGNAQLVEAPQPALAPLARTGWRIARHARCDDSVVPHVRATLEDTPFYARSLVDSRIHGSDVVLMHESLDLDRLDTRWVETLLPFRMPRMASRR
jgi:carotenoid 1,2-hydratase